jgi:hypothetical protein
MPETAARTLPQYKTNGTGVLSSMHRAIVASISWGSEGCSRLKAQVLKERSTFSASLATEARGEARGGTIVRVRSGAAGRKSADREYSAPTDLPAWPRASGMPAGSPAGNRLHFDMMAPAADLLFFNIS